MCPTRVLEAWLLVTLSPTATPIFQPKLRDCALKGSLRPCEVCTTGGPWGGSPHRAEEMSRLEAGGRFIEKASGRVEVGDWRGRENAVPGWGRGGRQLAASQVLGGLRVPLVLGTGLAQQDARADGGPRRPVADHVPVRRGQAVEVVNVELPGNMTAEVFHLLCERVVVSSCPNKSCAGGVPSPWPDRTSSPARQPRRPLRRLPA